VTVAKAYRLLKAVFNTAVADGLIRRNPCRIKGAGQERSPERPVLTVPEVYAVADSVAARYRGPALLGVFGSLRWGDLVALRRSDIDFQARTVRVWRQLSERRGGGFALSVRRWPTCMVVTSGSRPSRTRDPLLRRQRRSSAVVPGEEPASGQIRRERNRIIICSHQ
jgi:integrase